MSIRGQTRTRIVQTPEQAALLKELGCDAVQGIMFLPPMSVKGIVPALAQAAAAKD